MDDSNPAFTSSSEPDSGATTKKDTNWILWTLLILAVGSLLQGFFSNLQLARDWDTAWGGLANLVAVALATMVAHRLRWWLLIAVPVAIFTVSIGAVIGQNISVSWVQQFDSQASTQRSNCSDAVAFTADFNSTAETMAAWQTDFLETANPGRSAYERWSSHWLGIKQEFENMPEFAPAGSYVEVAIARADFYSQGYAEQARGNFASGTSYLQQGDDLLGDSQLAFAEMQEGMKEMGC